MILDIFIPLKKCFFAVVHFKVRHTHHLKPSSDQLSPSRTGQPPSPLRICLRGSRPSDSISSVFMHDWNFKINTKIWLMSTEHNIWSVYVKNWCWKSLNHYSFMSRLITFSSGIFFNGPIIKNRKFGSWLKNRICLKNLTGPIPD